MGDPAKSPKRPLVLLAVVGVAIVAGAGYLGYRHKHRHRHDPTQLAGPATGGPAAAPDASAPAICARSPAAALTIAPDAPPDAVIATKKLSSLLHDALAMPVLKDVLTEDFVYYYESSASFLGLKGTLRRIAYEHDLTIFDRVVRYALDTPAELAFWRGYDGRLKQFMLVVKEKAALEVVEAAAKAAADDTYLKVENDAAGAGKTTVYKVASATGAEVYFAALDGQLVIFNNKAMSLPTPELLATWSAKAEATLGAKAKGGIFTRVFTTEPDTADHSIYLSASYLTFGYQPYFASWKALRLRYENGAWSYGILASEPPEDDSSALAALWSAAPQGAAFCVAVPAEPEAIATAAKLLVPDQAAPAGKLAESLASPVGICWYPGALLYAPLMIAKLGSPPPPALLKTLFERAVGTTEAGILTEADKKAEAGRKAKLAEAKGKGGPIDAALLCPVRPSTFKPALAAKETPTATGVVLERDVSSQYAALPSKGHAQAGTMRSQLYFKVELASAGDYVLFSPDGRLVQRALDTLQKRYPPLADTLAGAKDDTILAVDPPKLAALLQEAALASLPADAESIFRASAEGRLVPALGRLAKYPLASAKADTTSGDHAAWEEMIWRSGKL